MNDAYLKSLAPVVLRIGIAGLLLWFGLSQMTAPDEWMSWVPEWASAITGLDTRLIVLLNGALETVSGVLLLLGLFTRWVSLVMGLHLVVIAYEIGYDAIAIRDLCIAVGCFAASLYGVDEWSLERKLQAHPGDSRSA